MKGEKAVEGRLTFKGAYDQRFDWAEQDGRRFEKPVGKEIIDIQGYFQTSDDRAAELSENEEKPWLVDSPFHGRMESEWIFLRKTKKDGVYSVKSAP